jgi:hypothetical protein
MVTRNVEDILVYWIHTGELYVGASSSAKTAGGNVPVEGFRSWSMQVCDLALGTVQLVRSASPVNTALKIIN